MTSLMLDSVYHAYKEDKILKGIYLQLARGETIGILGRNGCGKTTLFHISNSNFNCLHMQF